MMEKSLDQVFRDIRDGAIEDEIRFLKAKGLETSDAEARKRENQRGVNMGAAESIQNGYLGRY